MDVEAIKREAIDVEHLRLLALFHYISGGLTILFSSLFILHLIFMSFILMSGDQFESVSGQTTKFDPQQVVGVFVGVMATFIALGVAYGVAQIVSGRFIRKRRHRIFSIIIAIPNIVFIPYGTILAIMTLMVLDRRGVKAIYEGVDNREKMASEQ